MVVMCVSVMMMMLVRRRKGRVMRLGVMVQSMLRTLVQNSLHGV
jgi:hypothetical protein